MCVFRVLFARRRPGSVRLAVLDDAVDFVVLHLARMPHVLARRIRATETIAWGLPHVDLDDAEALTVREHGQEAMLVAVQGNLFEHTPIERTGTAAEIAIALPRHLRQCAVE